MDQEVQAFALCSSGCNAPSFEYDSFARKEPRSTLSDRNAECRGNAKRRGVLTHCMLQALDGMNYQGTYYELWWRSMRVARQLDIRHQHFQLTFSDMGDPSTREVFLPVGAAEAQAYAKRLELEGRWGEEENDRSAVCTITGACEAPLPAARRRTFVTSENAEIIVMR